MIHLAPVLLGGGVRLFEAADLGPVPLEGTLVATSSQVTDLRFSVPRIYRLTIVGTWPEGEAGFSMGITIGTPSSGWPPPPPIVTVPDVIGLTRSDAVARLTDVGFVSVSVATPAGQAGGVVTSEDPVPGTQTKTSTIRLTVSASG